MRLSVISLSFFTDPIKKSILFINSCANVFVLDNFGNTFIPWAFSAPASLSISIISLQYQYEISCSSVRMQKLITFNYLSNMKSSILPNCLNGEYGYHLREISNTTSVVFGAKMVFLKTKNVAKAF